MISITKEYKHDIFKDNDEILYHVNPQPISSTRIEARVASTKDFDNNYHRQFEYSYTHSKNLIGECFSRGYKAWIFEIGPLLTPVRLQKIKQFAPFKPLREKGLADVLNIQKSYQFPKGIKYAGIFSVEPDHFYDACLHVQGTLNAVIIFSKRDSFFSESSLDKLLHSATYTIDNDQIGYLNWISLCLEICPLSDIVVNPGGGYDDLFRSMNFYYCASSLDFDLQDMAVWRMNRRVDLPWHLVRWINRKVDLPWQSTNKRSLETVMFRDITGLLEMAVCCAKPPYAAGARWHPQGSSGCRVFRIDGVFMASQTPSNGAACEDQALQHAEIAQLKRENARLEEEVACLNKAATYLCLWVLRETTQVKSAMTRAHENQFPLAMLRRMASVSRSGSPLERPTDFR
jgi:hypothetical protein